ncbi:MAG: hypothetical protein LBC84_01730 [Prevotellaceae bacterium]|jgi:hypothetical protein|nr:hypothetical protein [Prevotellaceae bacterium]
MKRSFITLLSIILTCTFAQAQFGSRLGNAVQNTAERTVIRQAEQKTQKAVDKTIDNALDPKSQNSNDPKKATKETPSKPEVAKAPPVAPDVFPFEKGSYDMVTEVLGFETKLKIYFTQSGKWQAVENKSQIKFLGNTTKIDKLTITKGTEFWDLDLIEKTGIYRNLDSNDTDMVLKNAFGGSVPDGMEITELGHEVYLGFPCRKVNVKYSSQSLDMTCLCYGTLALKMEGSVMGITTTTRVTSMDLSAPPASKFEVPKGVTISN